MQAATVTSSMIMYSKPQAVHHFLFKKRQKKEIYLHISSFRSLKAGEDQRKQGNALKGNRAPPLHLAGAPLVELANDKASITIQYEGSQNSYCTYCRNIYVCK